jgi:hypothetical protein
MSSLISVVGYLGYPINRTVSASPDGSFSAASIPPSSFPCALPLCLPTIEENQKMAMLIT